MNFISSQNGGLLNLAHVINFNIAVGEGVSEDKKVTLTMYGVIATDIRGTTHELGLYETEKEAQDVLIEILAFIDLGKDNVFVMPDYSDNNEENDE